MQFKNEGYQVKRDSRCAVCGSKDCDKLTKHHIIGSCYSGKLRGDIRKKLRQIHWYYFEWDYCCLCDDCHLRYEKEFADLLHNLIWDRYNINLQETSYRNLKNHRDGKPTPSDLVMEQIKTPEAYLELRSFCIKFFIEKMQPKYSLL